MTTPALVLYYAPGSSSMAAHIALHEVGVPFEGRPLSLAKKQTRSAEFVAINPEARVPTLLVDGRPLTEVAGILWYLARRFPDAQLLPVKNVEDEAQVISWMSFLASTVHPARAAGIERAHRVWKRTERRFAGREWVLERHSIADIHLFRLFWRFFNAFHPPREDFPNLCALYDRMMARPAVQRTIEIETAVGYELPE